MDIKENNQSMSETQARRYFIHELGKDHMISASSPRSAASKGLTHNRKALENVKTLHVQRVKRNGKELAEKVHTFRVVMRTRTEAEKERALSLLRKSVEKMRRSASRLSGSARASKMKKIARKAQKKAREYEEGKSLFLAK